MPRWIIDDNYFCTSEILILNLYGYLYTGISFSRNGPFLQLLTSCERAVLDATVDL